MCESAAVTEVSAIGYQLRETIKDTIPACHTFISCNDKSTYLESAIHTTP